MNCEQIQQRLSAWIDGQLDEPERGSIGEHLGVCDRCAREAEEFDALDRVYAEADEIAPGAGFAAAVHARVRAGDERPAWDHWLTWLRPGPQGVLAMAAAVVLVTAATLWVSRAEARPAVITCRIDGMMCEQCDRQVHRILQTVPGVESVQVDAKTGRARMQLKRGSALSVNELTRAVNETRQYRITDVEVINEGEKQGGGETK